MFEVLQKINAEPLAKCLYCQGEVEKLISVSSFQFKGSGWYITDYKNKNKCSGTEDTPKKQGSNTKGSNKNASINK
jgi:putative FmdB family regulatory protein